MKPDLIMKLFFKRGYKNNISNFMTEIRQEHKSMSLPNETFMEYVERMVKRNG